jgi:tetratricopeptide (TPR) repeat protein
MDHNIIEKCQNDYNAGLDLSESVSGLSKIEVATIIAETFEADKLIKATDPSVFFETPLHSMNDWSLAVLAEIMFQYSNEIETRKEKNEKALATFQSRAWAALEQILHSPTASPLLWYEGIYLEVAQRYKFENDKRAIEVLKNGLAYTLNYQGEENALNYLRDIAETYVSLGELDKGLTIYNGLLCNNPKDIKAAERGLKLLEVTDDPEHLHDQFLSTLDELQQNRKIQQVSKGSSAQDTKIDSLILKAFRNALTMDFDSGKNQSITKLCHELIPDLNQCSIKRPTEMPKLPSREDVMKNISNPARPPQKPIDRKKKKTGRNEPCWCGSGKKYKYCHLQKDQAG